MSLQNVVDKPSNDNYARLYVYTFICPDVVTVLLEYIDLLLYIHTGLLTGDVDDFPPRLQELHTKVKEFIHSKIIPLEHEVMEYHDAPNTKWTVCSKIEQLKVCMYPYTHTHTRTHTHAHTHTHTHTLGVHR